MQRSFTASASLRRDCACHHNRQQLAPPHAVMLVLSLCSSPVSLCVIWMMNITATDKMDWQLNRVSLMPEVEAPDVGLMLTPLTGGAPSRDLRLSGLHIKEAGLWHRLQVGVLHRQPPCRGGSLAEVAPDPHQAEALQLPAKVLSDTLLYIMPVQDKVRKHSLLKQPPSAM